MGGVLRVRRDKSQRREDTVQRDGWDNGQARKGSRVEGHCEGELRRLGREDP